MAFHEHGADPLATEVEESTVSCATLRGVLAASLSRAVSAQVLEEIIVPATKREESLTDVPISIAAINTEKLIANGWNEVVGVLDFVPNVTFYQCA